MFSSVLGILLVGISYWLLKFLKGPKSIYLLHFFLLLTTPWLVILILGKPSFNYSIPNKIVCNQNSANSSCLLSLEFLFFQADSRTHYGIKDYGIFLPSSIPAMFIGLWMVVNKKSSKYTYIILVLTILATLTTLKSKENGLFSTLWIAAPISALVTLGFSKMLVSLRMSGVSFITKSLIVLNIGLLTYETARLYQVILFHKPFF